MPEWFKYVLFGCLLALIGSQGMAQSVFINEIHYDNSGGDVGEFIEVAGPAGTDLSCYQLILYNGGTNTAYSTTTLSGTIDDEGCGYGAREFAISGIQNGAPDGIVLYYDPSLCGGPGVAAVIQFLSYEGSFTASGGVANGMTSTDIGVDEQPAPAIGNSIYLTGNGTTYGDFTWTGPNTESPDNINTGQNFCACMLASSPTTNASGISTSAVGCTSMTISWTAGNGSDRLVVVRSSAAVAGTPTDQTTYTANSVFGSGDIIAAGEFVVYKGTGTSVTVTGLAPSTTYHVAVFEFNGSPCEENFMVTSVPTANETTSACSVCPYITSVLINSCAGSCSEGDNEIIFGNSGDYSFAANSTNINILYGNTNPPTTGYTDNIVSDAGVITDLHTAAGCSGVFIDAVGAGTIPANASFMVVHEDICASSALDFSAFCGQGPIYVIISQDPSWIASGNFVNSTSCSGGMRYFRADFSSVDASCVTDYNYACGSLSGTDGDLVTYNATGGAPLTYEDDDCNVPQVALPVTWLYFEGERINSVNELTWATASEQDNYGFQVQRSINGSNFETIAFVVGAGNSEQAVSYAFKDFDAPFGHVYYRLRQLDFHGDAQFSNTIALGHEENGVLTLHHFDITSGMLWYSSAEEYAIWKLMDVSGRVVKTAPLPTGELQSVQLSTTVSGYYLLVLESEGERVVQKVFLR